MPRLARKTNILFGSAGTTSEFAQFGSTVGPGVNNTKDPAVIQALTAWIDGWQDAIFSGDKAPVLQEMNALCFLFSYMLSYLFQQGIAEWDSATTYYIGNIVQKSGTSPVELYESLVDNNTGNPLPSMADNANWRFMNPQPNGTPGQLAKFTGARTFGDSVIQEVSGAIGIGGAPAAGDTLTVAGRIGSNSGGFRFPDNTVQTTAGVAATAGLFVQRKSNYNSTHPSLGVMTSFNSNRDNIPQVSDGTQVMSVSITPKSSTSVLRIRAVCWIGGYSPGIGDLIAAAFVNGGPNAVGAAFYMPNATGPAFSNPYLVVPVILECEYQPFSLATQNITLRAGASGSGAFLNTHDGNRNLGGVYASSLEVVEILA